MSGESITADVGRNLTLQSEQDSDRYDASQKDISAGGSFNFGSMTGSGYVSATQDKLHSNFDSVKEQTGLYAGSGGYDIRVGEHTQLDGAVIASTADRDKNSLDTGTLGWSDIHNQADYSATHSGASLSTGGPVGDMLLTNMAGSIMSAANNGGHDEGTTKAAVSEGSLTIRDTAKQQQNIAELNRDTEHANDGSISPIFNKEKEQKRLKEAQLIGEPGMQAADIARTQGEIIATKAANEKMKDVSPDQLKTAEAAWRKANPGKEPTIGDISSQAYKNFYNQAFTESGFGTGGKVQQALQAVTAAVQGLAGGNLAQAASGAAAPYIAGIIGSSGLDDAGKVLAHATVNAALAAAQGNNALVGAAGAATAELTGMIALNAYGKPVSGLSETEKQTVSALATLAAGLAGGLTGNSTADAVAGAQAGKTTVGDNALHAEDEQKRQDAKWLLPYLEGEKKRQAEKLISDLNAKDKAFDAALDSACNNLSSAECRGMRQDLAAMAKSYDDKLDGQYIGSMSTVYKEGKGQVDSLMWQYAMADAKAEREANVNRLAENWGVSKETATTPYDSMAAVHTTAAIGGAVYGMKGSSSAAKGNTSVESEKAALDKISQNGKNATDLSNKQPGSVLQQQAQNKINDLAAQFNSSSVQPKDFKITVNGKTMSADPETSIGAPVFKGASDSDVMTYFRQLAGSERMPDGKIISGKGTVYSIKITEGPGAGSTLTLRDFSNSSQQTGAKWTIDILTPSINNGKRVEVKLK